MPSDYEFIQSVIDDITEDGALPFSLPPASIPRIIKKSAQWFYRWSDDAVQERWLAIRYSDIVRDRTGNAVIQLPKCIQGVWQLYPLSGGRIMGDPLRFIREPLLYGAAMGPINSLSGFSNTGGMVSSGERREAYEEGILSIFAYAQDKTLFTKGVRFDYNENTNRLNLLGEVKGDIVFAAFQRIPLADLYQDSRFFDHVRGSVMERLKKILGTFNFSYPGEVQVQLSELQENGKDLREKTETDVKSESIGGDLFIIS